MIKEELEIKFAEGRKLRSLAIGNPLDKISSGTSFDLVKLLAGTWKSESQGWNLIALPVGPGDQFRLLMNQYGEILNFNRTADLNVPNRGVLADGDGYKDQLVNGISYEQTVRQVAVEDFPASNLKANNGDPIHHEPGFFLQLLNHIIPGHTEEDGMPNGPEVPLSIARLGSIPHGDTVLAMGSVETHDGPPTIDPDNAFPERINQDFDVNPYLAPYKHFQENPFFGNVPHTVPGFPGFFPGDINAILRFANPGAQVKRTTILNFDTKFRNAQLTHVPISNIPFVVREANVTEMHATFWIMELDAPNEAAEAEFVMQYTQTVYLEFFQSSDEPGRLIRWPHVSINTLRKG